MHDRSLVRSLALAITLILGGLGVAFGSTVAGTCGWNGSPSCTGGPPHSKCSRMVLVAHMCQAPVNAGTGTSCLPSAMASGITVFSAMQANPTLRAPAFCQWTCSMGTKICRINLSDGLPVELLEFGVAGELDEQAQQPGSGEIGSAQR